MKEEARILVTGANGQLGTVLIEALRAKYGSENVLATDIRKEVAHSQPYEFLDILNEVRLREIISDYKITQVYHLAAILSANGEQNPEKTWNINLEGLRSILRISVDVGLDKVFFPSTIAVFGETTPRVHTPQDVPLLPNTVYGMSKATGELWCNYYHRRYGLDVRSIRYPGVIGYQSIPSGGTTDYAVEIFHAALAGETYTCFLKPSTRLPMIYMPDAIRATIEVMSAPQEQIAIRYGYNLASMSFTPEELAIAIRRHIPDLDVHYAPDFRQAIADSWSTDIDDSEARRQWHWHPQYDIERMTTDMIEHLRLMTDAPTNDPVSVTP